MAWSWVLNLSALSSVVNGHAVSEVSVLEYQG